MVLDSAIGNEASQNDKSMRLEHHIATNELHQILDVATSYLDSGKIDEAAHLLNELFELGADSPEVKQLEQTIIKVRTAALSSTTDIRPLVHFTQPLLNVELQSANVKKLISETEQDYQAGRINSAFDDALLVASLAPDFIQNFVRLAELRLAMGDLAGAEELVETINQFQEVSEEPDDILLRAMTVALAPDNTSELVAYSRYLVAQNGKIPLDPFVPAAIRQTALLSPDTSRELFQNYVNLNPGDEESTDNYLRVTLAGGSPPEFIQAFTSSVHTTSVLADLLFLRTAAAILGGDEDWPAWLERSAAAVRNDPDQYSQITDTLYEASRIVPAEIRSFLELILALAVDNWVQVLAKYDAWIETAKSVQSTTLIAFLAAYSRSEAVQNLGYSDAAGDLETAAKAILLPEVDQFVSNSNMFGHPVDLEIILEQYVAALESQDSDEFGIDFIVSLREQYPENLEIRLVLAEQLIFAGENKMAIRELYFVARKHESSGDRDAMVTAIRKISDAASTNIELKVMLLDIYFQRGYLSDALRELENLAHLYQERMQITKALDAYARAAEIAFGTGNYSYGNELFDRAAEIDPENVEIRHRAVAYYLQTGAIERATLQLREIVRIAVNEDDPDEAVASLHQIIGLDPESADAYHKLGEVLTAIGEYSQAERVYGRLATIQPNDPILTAKQSALAVLATSH